MSPRSHLDYYSPITVESAALLEFECAQTHSMEARARTQLIGALTHTRTLPLTFAGGGGAAARGQQGALGGGHQHEQREQSVALGVHARAHADPRRRRLLRTILVRPHDHTTTSAPSYTVLYCTVD